jgi:hypothetical protein
MFRKSLGLAVLGVAASGSLLAVGCASESEKPYSVTGQQTTGAQDPRAFDRNGNYHAGWEGKPWLNPRYLDQKGHYRPEWVGEPGR